MHGGCRCYLGRLARRARPEDLSERHHHPQMAVGGGECSQLNCHVYRTRTVRIIDICRSDSRLQPGPHIGKCQSSSISAPAKALWSWSWGCVCWRTEKVLPMHFLHSVPSALGSIPASQFSHDLWSGLGTHSPGHMHDLASYRYGTVPRPTVWEKTKNYNICNVSSVIYFQKFSEKF